MAPHPTGTTESATPPQTSTPFQAYQLRHASAEEVRLQLAEMLAGVPGTRELLADRDGNRVLVRGEQQVQNLARQLIASLDKPAQPATDPAIVAPAPSEDESPRKPSFQRHSKPVFHVYSSADAEKWNQTFKRLFAGRRDAHFAADTRTSQLVVHAPVDVHAEVARQMGLAPNHDQDEPPVARQGGLANTPWPNPGAQQAAPSLTQVRPEELRENHQQAQSSQAADANATSATWNLRTMDGPSLHASLENLLQRPLPVQGSQNNVTSQFTLEIRNGSRVEVSIDNGRRRITLAGTAPAVDSWRRVIQAIDTASKPENPATRVVPFRTADRQGVVRALSALNSDAKRTRVLVASDRGGRTPAVATALQQQPNPGSNENQVPPANEEAPTGQQNAPDTPDGQPSPDTEAANGQAGEGQPLTPGEIANALGENGLLGPVQFDIIEGLDIIVLRGNQRDVDRVAELIASIEQVAQVTKPRIEILQLKHIGSEATAILIQQVYTQALTARQGSVSITALVKPNALLLIGRPENVETVVDLVQRLDHPVDAASQFRVFRLKHASAIDAQATVNEFFNQNLIQQPGQQQTQRQGLGTRVIVLADARSNSLVVHASPRDMIEIAGLVDRLDVASGEAVNELRLFKLENSLASELALILQEAINSQTARQGGVGQFQPGQQPGFQPGTGQPGQTQRQGQMRSVALQFFATDAEGRRRLNSGILADVRITADPRANSLLVTAPEKSMELIAALIERLDQPPAVRTQIKVFTITNGDAPSLVEMLEALLASQIGAQQGGALVGPGTESALVPLRFSVDERTNSIIASGTMKDLAVVEAILLRLDEDDVNERKTQVYRLLNAPAVDVANAINEYLRTERQVQQTAPGVVSPFEQIEREVVVVPESVSNSLIVASTERYYESVKDLVKQLDERPPMVMVQVLIAEVSLNDTDEFGVELGLQDSLLFDRSKLENIQTLSRTTTTQDPGGVTTTVQEDTISAADITPGFNFNNQPLGNSGSDGSLATAGKVAGQALSTFALGRINNELGYGGLVLSAGSDSVSVLLRALQESRRLEVLSRPQIMMLDNKPGLVQVGQRVPRITGTQITDAVQQNTITLDNVGLILSVTPRVSPDGLVVMDIDAENSDLGPIAGGIPISINAAGDAINSPIINTTLMQTTVSAMSGQTIVLGGLITKSTADVHRRVPLLADVPLLGHLFRYDSTREERTELLIIMTPRVVRSEKEAEMIKQIETARMNWVISDVIDIHGDTNLRSRSDGWGDNETSVVYPDMENYETVPTPAPDEEKPGEAPKPSSQLMQPIMPNASNDVRFISPPTQGSVQTSFRSARPLTAQAVGQDFRGGQPAVQATYPSVFQPTGPGSMSQPAVYQQPIAPLPPVRQ